ncbi:inorganic phosphate transporter [unidentified bacterial endosymbiont]|uniref:inorganic phosphate transporter n=1 Tax=unidentified bacterial endosymbiont TaxID=2355 RepID=UPI00209D424E|nr:inorganic phosphate transporter [unidentified bacterial endosymbiont]
MAILMEQSTLLLSVAALFGLLMAIGIGANDVANAMGTSVGSRAITIKQAIIIAMIFEFAGAFLAGGEVAQTIRGDIIDLSLFDGDQLVLIFGMMSALLAAATWLIIASWAGWPVSTTHSIIGGIIGFATVTVGLQAIQWEQVQWMVVGWLVTPLVAGIIAYIIFSSVQRYIFDTEQPFANAKRYGPFYIFLTVLVISLVTIHKGLRHIGLQWNFGESTLVAVAIALLLTLVGYWYIAQAKLSIKQGTKHFTNVERVFSRLMLITACAMAFAHGSNDVANAIGPLSAITAVLQQGDSLESMVHMVWWALPLGGVGIVLGLALLGHKVMATVGVEITDLTPSRGFAAEFSAAATVVIASGIGLPISTTQTLVGAVLGVGFARGIAALNLGVVRSIIVSWVVTLPIAAVLSMTFFQLLCWIFR